MVYAHQSLVFEPQPKSVTSVIMKHSEISNLLRYDHVERNKTNTWYFDKLPTTLQFPSLTQNDLSIFSETIQRENLVPLDTCTWDRMRLCLLEPAWLQNAQRQKIQRSLLDNLIAHPTFIKNIIAQYQNRDIEDYTSLEDQEMLFFTISALVSVLEYISTEKDGQRNEHTTTLQNTITQYKNNILECIRQRSKEWESFIRGADWLKEELQEDDGILINFLNSIALTPIDSPKQDKEIDLLQETMDNFIDRQDIATVHELNQQINEFKDMLDGIFSTLNNTTARDKLD
jgi:hypothetical protein